MSRHSPSAGPGCCCSAVSGVSGRSESSGRSRQPYTGAQGSGPSCGGIGPSDNHGSALAKECTIARNQYPL